MRRASLRVHATTGPTMRERPTASAARGRSAFGSCMSAWHRDAGTLGHTLRRRWSSGNAGRPRQDRAEEGIDYQATRHARIGVLMLDDILAEGLRLVICGTAAGTRSAELKQYYAGPGNKLWRILAETGLTPRRLAPSEAPRLLDFGIGLTDVVKGQSGSDQSLIWRMANPEALREKMRTLQPQWLCFNGKKAAQVFFVSKNVGYGEQTEIIGGTRLFVAPSTSGAANGFWDPSYWHELADRVGSPPAT